MTVPATWRSAPVLDPTWAPWRDGLPRRVEELLGEWDLTRDGDARHGRRALVVPVRTDAGEALVLKLTWPHPEAELEHLALTHWHGAGAVRLVRADPRRWALLLERAHRRDLTTVEDGAACELAGALLVRLRRPAPPQLEPLSRVVARWSERLGSLPTSAPLPRRLVGQAVSLARAFATDPTTDGTLLHTDLTFEKMLAADREPWLAIAPRPISGDPHHEVAPLLRGRWAEVVATGDVRWAVRRRFDAVVDAAGLDPDRARDWVVVRMLVDALDLLGEGAEKVRAPGPADRDGLTRALSIAKAVQG
ncbi:MAG TPA: aminoglycoside phosphotransferase family protein [Actinotalea sp.]|nr:aminoglycoside phosphotransferase family protein [Actinotalea sp.]